MGDLSKKLIKVFEQLEVPDIINLPDIQRAKEFLDELNNKLSTRFDNREYDPSHKMYMLLQNLLSYFAEEVCDIEGFESYYNTMIHLEESLMPSFPPMSPITSSYFTFWSFCDYQFGVDKETIVSIFYDIGKWQKTEGLYLKALEELSNSFVGFYEYKGQENDLLLLRRIDQVENRYCICPSGYKGNIGEIIYCRLVKNLDSIYDYDIMLTTPYVILNYGKKDWDQFFQRQIKASEGGIQKERRYRFLKHHPDYSYWHDYIIDGFVNYQEDRIYLTGIPDIKGSKPHEL